MSIKCTAHLTSHLLHPNAPQKVTGVQNSADGSVTIDFDAAEGAKSYIIHYGGANEDDPKEAVFMGYSEKTSWTLSAENVPEHTTGDKLYFYVQAYNEFGIGSNEIEKARYLHDGEFTGSAWSDPAIITTA